MLCPKCGASTNPTQTICDGCEQTIKVEDKHEKPKECILCISCHNYVQSGKNFCNKCGAKVGVKRHVGQDVDPVLKCLKCLFELAPDDVFCAECGFQVERKRKWENGDKGNADIDIRLPPSSKTTVVSKSNQNKSEVDQSHLMHDTADMTDPAHVSDEIGDQSSTAGEQDKRRPTLTVQGNEDQKESSGQLTNAANANDGTAAVDEIQPETVLQKAIENECAEKQKKNNIEPDAQQSNVAGTQDDAAVMVGSFTEVEKNPGAVQQIVVKIEYAVLQKNEGDLKAGPPSGVGTCMATSAKEEEFVFGTGKQEKESANQSEKKVPTTEKHGMESDKSLASNAVAKVTNANANMEIVEAGHDKQQSSAKTSNKSFADVVTGAPEGPPKSMKGKVKIPKAADDNVKPQTRSDSLKTKRENSHQQVSPMVQVHFHVLVSSDLNVDIDKDKVCIVFGLAKYGGWKNKSHQMMSERKTKDEELVMKYTMEFDADDVTNNSVKVQYKYVVMRPGGKVDWEHIFMKEYGGPPNRNLSISGYKGIDEQTNRQGRAKTSDSRHMAYLKLLAAGDKVVIDNKEATVKVIDRFKRCVAVVFDDGVEEIHPSHSLDIGHVWDKYDGYIFPIPKKGGFISSLKKLITSSSDINIQHLKELGAYAMLELLPKWNQDCCEDYSSNWLTVKMAWNSFMNAKCFLTKDLYGQNSIAASEVLLLYIKPSFDYLVKAEEKKLEGSQRLAIALFLVSVMQSCSVTPPDSGCIQTLFDALLIHQDNGDKCLEFENLLKTRMMQESRLFVTEKLESFCHSWAQRNPPECKWILAMPLLHFLRKDSVPFQTVAISSNDGHDKSPTWWGLSKEDEIVSKFKYHTNHQKAIPILSLVNQLYPLFEVDHFIPRTLMATMSPCHLQEIVGTRKIPASAVLGTLVFYLKQIDLRSRYQYVDDYHHSLVLVTACLGEHKAEVQSSTLNKEDKDKPSSKILLREVEDAVNIAFDILRLMLPWRMYGRQYYGCDISFYGLVCEALNVFFAAHSLFLHVHKMMELPTTCFETTVGEVPKMLYEWTKYDLSISSVMDFQELELWSRLLSVVVDESYSQVWQFDLLTSVEDRVKLLEPIKRVELYCYKDYSKLNDDFEKCISRLAFEAAEKLCQNRNNRHNLFNSSDSRLWIMLSNVFEKQWPDAVDGFSMFKHMLSWPSFTCFLRVFGDEAQVSKLLPNCQEKLIKGLSVLGDINNRLLNGSIKVFELQTIYSNQQSFLDILEALEESQQHLTACASKSQENNIKLASQALKYYKLILDSFYTLRQHIAVFINLADSLSQGVDFKDLRSKIRLEIKDMSIVDICCSATDRKLWNSNLPTISIFRLHESMLAVLPPLFKIQESIIFKTMWTETGKKALKDKTSCSLEELIGEVWVPVYQQWQNIFEEISQGTVTFKDIDQYLSQFNGNSENLRREFQFYHGAKNWIDQRLDQLSEYYKLERYKNGAKKMLEASDSFELTGDFSVVNLLASAGEKKLESLKSLNKDVVKAGHALAEMDDTKANCISTFVKCKPLIDWLRDSIKGTKELKTLVDLASISSGESDIEVHRVSCLHDAVTGYAALIYDLETSCDFTTFLQLCQLVWKACESDPKLPEKLRDTNRHLEWVRCVKETHGSVEMNSLAQAEAINSSGLYAVGFHAKDCSKNIHNSIQLTVLKKSENNEQNEQRKYTYDELKDLQSKLMLIAGKAQKGKEDVDRFVEMFDSVVRLANAYVKLCASGCILFQEWKVHLFCQSDRYIHSYVDFGLSDQKLVGYRKNNEDVVRETIQLCEFLENCCESWNDYVCQQRGEFEHLNYFTTDQLVILRRQLAQMMSPGANVDICIYPLLSSVYPDCGLKDINRAFVLAAQEIDGQVDADEDEETVETTDASNLLELNKEFLSALTSSGYSDTLAKKALAVVGPENIDDGIIWCLEHDDEPEDSVENMQTENNIEEVPETPQLLDALSLATVTEDLIEEVHSLDSPLKNKLEELWKGYLRRVYSSVTEFLSTKHLGIILKHLASFGERTAPRHFHGYLEKGTMNLLVCPQRNVLNVVLMQYMPTDWNLPVLPLPSIDEVLLCTSQTTVEEVELILRRAVADKHGKIFSLVNADLLDYENSEKIEKSIDAIMKGNKDYQLVVICSSENEDKSRIVTALDKYRRVAPGTRLDDVRDYVKRQLTTNDVMSAAFVDYEKCGVRLVKSARAGVGKTLVKQRLQEKLLKRHPRSICLSIPIHEKCASISSVLKALNTSLQKPESKTPRMIHIDVAHEVLEGVDNLLFNLLILGALKAGDGHLWRKSASDMFVIETVPLLATETKTANNCQTFEVHHILQILPSVTCKSPTECLSAYQSGSNAHGFDPLMDGEEFKSDKFQAPFLALQRVTNSQGDINPLNCLHVLLSNCGVQNPSWAELRHFVWFLKSQLDDLNRSSFCGAAAADILPGFDAFVISFLIKMSRDFATRSLEIAEDTSQLDGLLQKEEGELLDQFKMKRKWETSPHPYLFFNADGHSMTFMGFVVRGGNIIVNETNEVVVSVAPQLQQGLTINRVNLSEDFNALPRHAKITKMCSVIGIEFPHDPDPTYELTTDNVKKILAIHMRFRCRIPVIIMGETGCGKTRLIKFMCDLQAPPGADIKNMVLMKVHGGTFAYDIEKKVRYAQELAERNRRDMPNVDTVMFFDEANTTEAIGLIKEILCDGSMNGKPLQLGSGHGLRFIAACNPYRKHSDEMIRLLEQAGLGYHVKADETTDRLGRIPMRRLVYRVQALPQSLLPLIWDFGQLNDQVEELYINQMVQRYAVLDDRTRNIISHVLQRSQSFMKQQENECSFVSLRDIERTLKVMAWFLEHEEIFDLMDELEEQYIEAQNESGSEDDETAYEPLEQNVRSLILALGVCYHACLRDEARKMYRESVAESLRCSITEEQILNEIDRCQEVFLNNIQLDENIAKNQALKENIFMMVVCIELRIPLFLVGKPGSSKSLAKTIVADAMQGEQSRTPLFKSFKQVHMVSYQCSPLSTPDGIVGTFRQCGRFQKDKNLDKFVSVVVLDEVGLAEDSPRMPLKTLHPLLEDGCEGDEEPEDYKKVAFIGISNWALDPAKMNRGILVQRDVPDHEELVESARGICSYEKLVETYMEKVIRPMAVAYLELYERARTEKREFFGLRDFYSMVKMVYSFGKKSKKPITWPQLKHAILRNFGGLENIDPVEIFAHHMASIDKDQAPTASDPDCSPNGLIEAGFQDSDSRYLLVLTENYAALGILQQKLLSMKDVVVIFGSSFPKDQEYTQVCRNINRIKVCMETGRTVVLLNLENLYESLYDALNQYYVYMGGDRFVDLGLGSHRVKCRVHNKFRLIVVAEKQAVYEKFPIPLINRLEKHFLSMTTMLSENQIKIADELEKWVHDFINPMMTVGKNKGLPPGDVFIGYSVDTPAAVVLQVHNSDLDDNEVLEKAHNVLLQCATPEAVVRLTNSKLSSQCEQIKNRYFKEQKHASLYEFLEHRIKQNSANQAEFLQVTTHSRLLPDSQMETLARQTGMNVKQIHTISLHALDTEQQFCKRLRDFFSNQMESRLLLIQCDGGDQNADLIACTRYSIQDEFLQATLYGKTWVVFVIKLPRIEGGCFVGFQGGHWNCVHIDELKPAATSSPAIDALCQHSVSNLFAAALPPSSKPRVLTRMEFLQSKESSNDTERVGGKINDEGSVDSVFVGLDRTEEKMDLTEATDPPVDSFKAREHPPCQQQIAMDVEEHSHMGKLDLNSLILSCIPAAASMLKDGESCHNRTTSRVEMVLRLVKESLGKDLGFAMVVMKRIHLLLEDRENTVTTAERAKAWLSNEATSADKVNKAGTFRRSWLQHVESKVTPCLAGLLAMSDINQNLDILANSQQEDWVNQFWLRMLDCPILTTLTYTDLRSPIEEKELTEFDVQTSRFTGRLPFSWILKQLVDDLVEKARNERDQTKISEDEDLVMKLLNDSGLGCIVNAVPDDKMDVFCLNYLHDYIRMVYNASSETEHDLLLKAILNGCEEQLHRQERCDDYRPTVAACHMVYHHLSERLQHFGNLVKIWPKLLDHLSSNELLGARKEMILDAVGLACVMEHLTPVGEELNVPQKRHDWMKKVQSFSACVETIFQYESRSRKENLYGATSQRHIVDARFCWNRISAVYLFIEHVCSDVNTKDKLSVKRCGPFWKLLGDRTDFKTEASMTAVKRFLETCNKTASQTFLGTNQTCSNCEKPMENPIKLPCEHVFCKSCVAEMQEIDRKCPQCKKEFKKSFKLEVMKESRESSEQHNIYKQQIRSFFIELVSRLCFADDRPPEPPVIKVLLDCVTRKSKDGAEGTRNLSILGDCIDPTPVVRSFLLQLLLRSSPNEVIEHLHAFFTQSQLYTKNHEDLVELVVLCVQCFEDSFANNHGNLQSSLETCSTLLDEAVNDLQSKNVLDRVIGIARSRFGLDITASLVYNIHCCKEMEQTRETRDVLRCARDLCTADMPSQFLVKQLCRRYGLDCLQIIDKTPVKWVIPNVAQVQEENCPDRFVITGDLYNNARDAVYTLMLEDGNSSKKLKDKIQKSKLPPNQKQVCLFAALYKEVALASKQPSKKIIDKLEAFCTKNESIHQEDLASQLLHNRLSNHCQHLQIDSETNSRHAMVVELIVHALIMLRSCNTPLLQPFFNLVSNPAAMKDSYFPTMPQDDTFVVKEALLKARPSGGSENPVLYECPNGHPYVIGDCGRPYSTAKCQDCGAQIGGEGHREHAGNKKFSRTTDTTSTGHILGAASSRTKVAIPERQLTPGSTVIIRLLTHITMYLGANTKPEAVASALHPNVAAGLVPQFLWDHIQCDLATLSKTLSRSVDDCVLLIHLILHRMLVQTDLLGNVNSSLNSKDSREKWETAFARSFVVPLLQNLNSEIQEANRKMMADQRMSNNPLYGMIFESVPAGGQGDGLNIVNEPAVWRYRTRVTVEHLMHQLNEMKPGKSKRGGNSFQLLHSFLHSCHHLQAVGYLPDILQLQQILVHKYHRVLDTAEATNIKVKDTISKFEGQYSQTELRHLFNSFAKAWDTVRDALSKSDKLPTDVLLPKDYTEMVINEDTSLAVFMPCQRGLGLCSVALVNYLIEVHNDFMTTFCRLTNQEFSSFPEVQALNATSANLISFSIDNDILPMVMAHCHYSLKVGQGTTISYDYDNLQKHLCQRFFQGKAKIVPKVDMVVYREDSTNAKMFEDLQSKIEQEALSPAVQNQIQKEMKNSLIDVADSLASLDIAINFLVSVGGDPERKLHEFMSGAIKLETPVRSSTARQCCRLKHVQSLWLVLSFERAKLLTKSGQDPFDNIPQAYKEELSHGQKTALKRDFLPNVDVQVFLMELHECLVLNLLKNNSREDSNLTHPLGYTLTEYMVGKGRTPMNSLEERFPRDILVSHVLGVWELVIVFNTSNQK